MRALAVLVVVAASSISCGGTPAGKPTSATPAAKPAPPLLPCATDAICDEREEAAFLEAHIYLDDDAVLRLAAPVLQARCDAGIQRACQRLGIFHAHGLGLVPRDLERAFVLFERACDGGFLPACTDAGYAYEQAEGVTANAAKAAKLYERACDAGDLLGCNNLGALFESGNGLPQDGARARTLYQRACDGGHRVGCRNLGLAWLDGIGGGEDVDRAVELIDRACADQDATACAHLAELHFDGRGVVPDAERGVALAQGACDAGVGWICVDLGLRFENADEVPEDAERAAVLYRRACELEAYMGCNNLGVLTQDGKGGTAQSDAVATELYAKACDGGTALGCRNAGWMHEEKRAPDWSFDRSTEFYRRACELNDAAACSYLGEAYRKGRGIARNTKLAVRYLTIGCDGGDGWGCTELGIVHEEGDGLTDGPNPARARELYRRGCVAQNWRGCAHLSELLKDGEGGPVDLAGAQVMAELACREEDDVGCVRLGDLWFDGTKDRVIDDLKALEAWSKACDLGSADGCANAAMLHDDGFGVKYDTATLKAFYRKGCALGDEGACDDLQQTDDDDPPPVWAWDGFTGACKAPELVAIKGGKFTMGAPAVAGREFEHPEHLVEVSAFKLLRHEVTKCQYKACVAAKRCAPPDTTAMDKPPHDAMEPVTGVTWAQANEFCAWKGWRLPTEAEWEYAARGSDGRTYPWGDAAPTCAHADWQPSGEAGGCDGDGPSLVGAHASGASPFGIHDMAGNVREWTADWIGGYGPEAVKNPRGPHAGTSRVVRGGGWHNSAPQFISTYVRFRLAPVNANVAVGFRCAK